MDISMAGIDYKTAGIHRREPFSLDSATAKRTMLSIGAHGAVHGCVLLSTCNRTELYITGERSCDPAGLLCHALSLPYKDYADYFALRKDRQAIRHLMMVATGLRSQLRGEDQILAQVKGAIQLAREAQCMDSVLETLFRVAVSAGKQAKASVALAPVDHSVAHRALSMLKNCTSLAEKKVLIIGNGEMGRLTARLLLAEGCRVTVTVRAYKTGPVKIEAGCGTIPYPQRHELIPACDILVSATTSPHYTVTGEMLAGSVRMPDYIVDLAVPRDIEPGAAELATKGHWDVDSLGGNALDKESGDKLMQIVRIQNKYLERFDHWRSYRQQCACQKG